MKKINCFMALLCMTALSSCSSDTEEFVNGGKSMTIGVTLPDNDGTRVDFKNDITKMAWESGDKLTVVGYGADGKYASHNISSELISGAEQGNGTFVVKMDAAWSNVEFAYVGKNISVAGNENPYVMAFGNQVQNGAGNMAHLKDYILLKSKKFMTANLSDNSTFQLSPAMSILKLNVKNLPAEMAKENSYEFSYYINYGSTDQVRSAKLTYSGGITADANNYIYMAFDPNAGKLNADGKIAFEVKAGTKTAVAYAKADKEKTYAAGKIYTATLDYNNTENLTWVSDAGETMAAPAKRSPAVLVLYSGQRCGNCPYTDEFRQSEQDQYGSDNYIYTVLHVFEIWSPKDPEISLLNKEGKTYRESMVIKDGNGKDPEAVPDPYFNTLGKTFRIRMAEDAFAGNDILECKLDVKTAANNKYQIFVDTHVRSDKKDFMKDKDIDILLWTLEDGIEAFQAGVSGNHAVHNHIFRGSINGTWGEPYKIGTSYKGTFAIPETVTVKENTDIVVMFIDHTTKEIYDASHFKIGTSTAAFK